MNSELSRHAEYDRGLTLKPLALRGGHQHSSLYDQLEHSIGDGAADKLVADFGGRRLYIPMAPASGDLVSRSIGLVAATAMARIFGGDRLLIPVTSDHARRRVRIVALRAEHLSISHIAHQLRCTERYVYKVLAEKRAACVAGAASAALKNEAAGASAAMPAPAHRLDPRIHPTTPALKPGRSSRGHTGGR
ncbi:MAG TPA: helix-turn-helix domain-containing protein [Candidatus Acidoferrales bacterium]|nr:helix-turn-helix domain-containing protein [Candidatus Acidoferrales bacterium]